MNYCRSQARFPVFDLGSALGDFVDAADVSIVRSFHVEVCGCEDDGSVLKELHRGEWWLLAEGPLVLDDDIVVSH